MPQHPPSRPPRHPYGRLMKRGEANIIFWREKVYEIVGNYRLWKKFLLPHLPDTAPQQMLWQKRRLQRLVAQAFFEYRRAQAEQQTLRNLTIAANKKLARITAADFTPLHRRHKNFGKKIAES
jgi:hypothetical protein